MSAMTDQQLVDLLNKLGVVYTPLRDAFGELIGTRFRLGELGCFEFTFHVAPKYVDAAPVGTVNGFIEGIAQKFTDMGVSVTRGDGW